MNRKLILYIAMSLDGDLAKADDNIEKMKFKRSISYPSGLVQLWYDVIK